MLLKLGQLMTRRHKTLGSSSQGGYTGVYGLLVDFNYPTNWVGPAKIALYDGNVDVTESMNASEPFNEIIAGFDDLALGEFNTDSDYNANVRYWNAPWPGSNSPHWSDTKTSSLKAWFKFTTPMTRLSRMLITLRNPQIYGLPPDILFSDMMGNSYVPVSKPADIDDYVEIIATSNRSYEYIF